MQYLRQRDIGLFCCKSRSFFGYNVIIYTLQHHLKMDYNHDAYLNFPCSSDTESVWLLFQRPRIIFITMTFYLTSAANVLIYYMLKFSAEKLSSSPYLSCWLLSLSDLPSAVVVHFCSEWVSNLTSLFLSLISVSLRQYQYVSTNANCLYTVIPGFVIPYRTLFGYTFKRADKMLGGHNFGHWKGVYKFGKKIELSGPKFYWFLDRFIIMLFN